MINKDKFSSLLLSIGFSRLTGKPNHIYCKQINGCELMADFDNEMLMYPERDGLVINERQTCNFSDAENAVVFECVHRLLDIGYRPEHIEIEPRWKLGHEQKSGRADILIKNNFHNAFLIVECKTWGDEFDKEWKKMLSDGGQLFSYAQQARSTQYLCLYASDYLDGQLEYINHIVTLNDNEEFLKTLNEPFPFLKATDVLSLYKAWSVTYDKEFETQGIFEKGVSAYEIGRKAHTVDDLQAIRHDDIQKKYHEFATILRQHNVSGRENAFDKLVNLFLAKIVDEMQNPTELHFYWKGSAYDDYYRLQDRIQRLYRDGMQKFLSEEVTYIDDNEIEDAFRLFKNDPDATRDTIKEYFRKLKYYTNNDFTFLDVHNEKLFLQNSVILLKIVKMIQGIRLKTDEQNQFLGDLFEGFLDQGIKQSEGQFFTPLPIVKFLVSSLPLEQIISDSTEPLAVIDYACGAGHFLNEYATQIRTFLDDEQLPSYYEQIVGIEKEYRLSKVAKVSAFMYGQDNIQIVYADALAKNKKIENGKFNLLISNPPYSVRGFLEMLTDDERSAYELTAEIDNKVILTNNAIELFFIERAKQLLAPGGIAAIILPSSILFKSNAVYIKAREILFQFFDIVGIVELGGGTFGKTDTHTVTVFLRRKDENPSVAVHYKNRVFSWFKGDFDKDNIFEDSKLLEVYCLNFGYEPNEYKTLLSSTPSQKLLDTDTFKAYHEVFINSSDIKNLMKKQIFKRLLDTEKQEELNKRFIEYVHRIEKEKLYYFLLAYSNPQDVIVVKSPSGTDIKRFLGYEWSGAKGNEGIKYIGTAQTDENDETFVGSKGIASINTPLFNPIDLMDKSKINSIIRLNFGGVTIGQSEFVSRFKLVDMIDFSGVKLEKAISLNVARSDNKSRYPLIPINSHFEYSKSRISSSDLTIDTYIGVDNLLQNRLGKKPSDFVPNDGFVTMYTSGDILLSNIRPYLKKIWFAENTGGCSNDVLAIHPLDDVIESKFLFYIISQDSFFDYVMQFKTGIKMPRGDKERIMQYQVPLPPKAIQREIITTCENLDKEYTHTHENIEKYHSDIESIFQNIEILSPGALSLSNTQLFDISIGKRVVETELVQDGAVPVYSANVFAPFGFIDKLHITDFDTPSVLWGIDGDWQVNYMPEKTPFYPTDHCGVLRVKDASIHPRYLTWMLNKAGIERGFSRNLRASIDRIKRLTIDLPEPKSQKRAIDRIRKLEEKLATAEHQLLELETKRQDILASHLT